MAKPPESTKTSLRQRLAARAAERWPQLAGIDVRYRGEFAYVAGQLPDGTLLLLMRLRYAGLPAPGVLPSTGPATTTTKRRSCPPAGRLAPPGSPRLRLRPLPRRPHCLAHSTVPDELTGAPTSGEAASAAVRVSRRALAYDRRKVIDANSPPWTPEKTCLPGAPPKSRRWGRRSLSAAPAPVPGAIHQRPGISGAGGRATGRHRSIRRPPRGRPS